jgi:hypothetical protein
VADLLEDYMTQDELAQQLGRSVRALYYREDRDDWLNAGGA